MGTNPNRESTFRFRQFEVRNHISGMKVGTDGVLLGAWCPIVSGNVLDVGTGSGLIALMAAQRMPNARITGIDISRDAIEEASFNAGRSPWSDRLNMVTADFADEMMLSSLGNNWHLIISNPPYFHEKTHSPVQSRAIARHAGSLHCISLIKRCAVGDMLSHDGMLAMITPASCENDITFNAQLYHMPLLKMTRVYTTPKSIAPTRLLSLIGAPGLNVSTYVHDSLIIGSEKYTRITEPFYLPRH